MEKTADNGRKRLQYFCGTCGSPIYSVGEGDAANVVGIRAGTNRQFPNSCRDHRSGVRPPCHGL